MQGRSDCSRSNRREPYFVVAAQELQARESDWERTLVDLLLRDGTDDTSPPQMGCYPPGWAGVVRGVYPPATMRTKLLRLSSFSSEPCVGTAETDMTSHRYEPGRSVCRTPR